MANFFPRWANRVPLKILVILLVLATLVTAMPPMGVTRLLLGYYPEKLLAGELTWNLGRVAGLGPGWSLVPFYAVLAGAAVALFRVGSSRGKPEGLTST